MADEHDIEDPVKVRAPHREFTEAAYLLAMWSILVANEGAIRFIQHGLASKPGELPWTRELFQGTPNRFAAPFLGGLFEVIFGLFGLAVGLAAGTLGYYSKQLTLALMATQNVLGWYVFIDYVFVIPSYRISQLTEATKYGALSLGNSKFMGVLGILTSFAFCLALQGGQFVFMARLIAFGSDSDFLKQRSGSKFRAIFWNGNLALAGLWVVIQAALVINGAGGGIVERFFAPPNVGRIPVYLLINGLVMLFWPLLGIVIAMSGYTSAVRSYAAMSFVTFLFIYVHYTIGQMGFLGGAGPAAGAAMHNGLTMMVTFLGPYFMVKQAQEAEL